MTVMTLYIGSVHSRLRPMTELVVEVVRYGCLGALGTCKCPYTMLELRREKRRIGHGALVVPESIVSHTG